MSRDRAAKDIVAEFPLPHGCCLAMEGAFQTELYHGVTTTARKAFAPQRRINITVRAWLEHADKCFK